MQDRDASGEEPPDRVLAEVGFDRLLREGGRLTNLPQANNRRTGQPLTGQLEFELKQVVDESCVVYQQVAQL